MIIFLFGPDDYRRVQKKKEIIAEFRKKRSEIALGTFDLEADGALARLEAFLGTQSIFETVRLAVVANAFEPDADKLKKVISPAIHDKSVQVLLCEREKPVKALAFLLDKPSLSQKFEHLAGAEWLAFMDAEAKRAGVTLGAGAPQFLASVYQGNAWGLVTELQKLAGLGAKSLGRKELDEFELEASPNYWGLLMGARARDMRTRLLSLEALLALADPPPKIFNILSAQWIEKIPRMAEYDLAVKSGKLDYEEALLDLAIS